MKNFKTILDRLTTKKCITILAIIVILLSSVTVLRAFNAAFTGDEIELSGNVIEPIYKTELWKLIEKELSGLKAQEYCVDLAPYYREVGGNPGFNLAVEYFIEKLKEFGCDKVGIVEAPMDGTYPVPYRPTVRITEAWEPIKAVLKVTEPEEKEIVSFLYEPRGVWKEGDPTGLCLAINSHSTPPEGVEADLVYVPGGGDSDDDYVGIDVMGKVVLARGSAGAIYREAVVERKAVGVISHYLSTQAGYKDTIVYEPIRSSETCPDLWSKQSIPYKAEKWAFSVSYNHLQYLRGLLAKGSVNVFAEVKAETYPSVLLTPYGEITGSKYPEEKIVFFAHLCHYSGGGNDNTSGLALVLEMARTITTLIREGKIPRPERTLVFVVGKEMTGSALWLEKFKAEWPNIILGINFDMVGEDPHKCLGPAQILFSKDTVPTFFGDLEVSLMEAVAQEVSFFGIAPLPGLWFDICPYMTGTDIFTFCEYANIPAVSFDHFPDRYYHASQDTWDKTSPQEFKRIGHVATLGALLVANAGLPEAAFFMHTTEDKAESRLGLLGRLIEQKLMDAKTPEEVKDVVEEGKTCLKNVLDIDLRGIDSALVLVKHLRPEEQAAAHRIAAKMKSDLNKKARAVEASIDELARILGGEFLIEYTQIQRLRLR